MKVFFNYPAFYLNFYSPENMASEKQGGPYSGGRGWLNYRMDRRESLKFFKLSCMHPTLSFTAQRTWLRKGKAALNQGAGADSMTEWIDGTDEPTHNECSFRNCVSLT